MNETELKLQRIAALFPLLRLLTVKQVIGAGDAAIAAAGLNPWCLKEGLAEGTERAVNEWRIKEAIDVINAMTDQSRSQVTALDNTTANRFRVHKVDDLTFLVCDGTTGEEICTVTDYENANGEWTNDAERRARAIAANFTAI